MPTARKALPWGHRGRLPLETVRDRVAALAKNQGFEVEFVPWKQSWANNPRYVSKRTLLINGILCGVYSIQNKLRQKSLWVAQAKISQSIPNPPTFSIYHLAIEGEPERLFVAPRREVENSYTRTLTIPLHQAKRSDGFNWNRFENAWSLFVKPPTL